MFHWPGLWLLALYTALITTFVVKVDPGVLLVATTPLLVAVFTYFSAKRQRELIRRENMKASAAAADQAIKQERLIAEAAAAAKLQSELIAAEVKKKVEEVHELVNGQKTALEVQKASLQRGQDLRDEKIAQLEQRIADLKFK